jgi:hypothetical protein
MLPMRYYKWIEPRDAAVVVKQVNPSTCMDLLMELEQQHSSSSSLSALFQSTDLTCLLRLLESYACCCCKYVLKGRSMCGQESAVTATRCLQQAVSSCDSNPCYASFMASSAAVQTG